MFFVYSYICTHKIPIMRGYFTIIIALITTLAVTFVDPVLASQPEPRTHYSLNDGWRFYNTAKPNASVQYLDLPQVWSVDDVVLSTANYSRQLHVPHTSDSQQNPVRWLSFCLCLAALFSSVATLSDLYSARPATGSTAHTR